MTDRETDLISETEVIQRAQAGDVESFCILAARYERRIYLLAFHYCHNSQDAEDLSQEVWLKAYQALSTFKSDAAFYTWLRRITINTFLNHQRSTSFRRQGQTTLVKTLFVDSDTAEKLPLSSVASEESIYNKVLFKNVVNALAELTPSQRLMFLLRHYEGMSYDEIATAMNCSTGTAKKAVWRALGTLRVKLADRNEAPDDHLAHLATEF